MVTVDKGVKEVINMGLFEDIIKNHATEIWNFIFLAVGAFLGFLTSQLKDYFQNKQRKSKYLKALLGELDYNKKLVNKNEKKGYDTSAYIDAKETKYLYDLPTELRNNINDAQIMLINARLRDHLYYHEKLDLEKLKKLLEESIPEFENYIKKL